MVVHACNPIIWELETGGSETLSRTWQRTDFDTPLWDTQDPLMKGRELAERDGEMSPTKQECYLEYIFSKKLVTKPYFKKSC